MNTSSCKNNIEKYLQHYNEPYFKVENLIKDYCGTAASLIAGSVPEGFGNQDSDLDVLVVGQPNGLNGGINFESGGLLVHFRYEKKGYEVQFTCWPDRVALEVLSRFKSTIQTLKSPKLSQTNTPKITLLEPEELLFIHRLKTGLHIVNSSRIQSWKDEFELEYLCVYGYFRWAMLFRSGFEDALAQLSNGGDRRTALWMMSNAANSLAKALLSSIGETNPNEKWTIRYLTKNVSTLGRETVERLISFILPNVNSDEKDLLNEFSEFSGAVLAKGAINLPDPFPRSFQELVSQLTVILRHVDDL